MADYYAVLGTTRDVDTQAVQHAYRDLALKWHPLRNKEPNANEAFDEISEAFQVLSDFECRALFDKYGEVGLKEGVPDGAGGLLGGTYAYRGDGLDIFEEFFGTSNPYAPIVEAAGAESKKNKPATGGKEQTVYIEVTLDDLYLSASKTWSVGARSLRADLKPEYTTGSTLSFKDDGSGSGAVKVVLQEAAHTAFSRTGDTLYYTASISVLDALVGCSIAVTSMDGRELSIPVSDIVHPGYTMTVAGEGMPAVGGGRGDLVVSFDVKYPKSLRPDQKVLLKTGLCMPRELDEAQDKALTHVKNAFGQ